jgi:hypothetical protein
MTFSTNTPGSSDLCCRVVTLLAETRAALGFEGVPEPEAILEWQPLLDQIRQKALFRHREMSGIDALQGFCRIWDPRMAAFARHPEAALFSRFEVATMIDALSLYARWLHRNFSPQPAMFPN